MVVSQRSAEIIKPDFGFLRTVEEISGQSVSSCYRCLKCSGGCPMAEEMDYPPDRIVRMVQLGLRDQLLSGRSIWLCTGCVACSDRCPNGIDVARVIDSLRQIAAADRYTAGEPLIAAFHEDFLGVVKRYGRLHEATLIALLKLKSHDWLADVGCGLQMFLKGKIPLFPRKVSRKDQVASLIESARQSRLRAKREQG